MIQKDNVLKVWDNIVKIAQKNIFENIDDSDDGPTQSLQKDNVLKVWDNIVNIAKKYFWDFFKNIDDSDDGPTQGSTNCGAFSQHDFIQNYFLW